MRVVSSLLSGWQVLRGRAQRFKEKVKGCFSSTKFKLLIRNKAKEEELLFTVVCTLLHSYDPKSSLTVSVSSLASFQQQKCPRTREHRRIVALCTDARARAHTHSTSICISQQQQRKSSLEYQIRQPSAPGGEWIFQDAHGMKLRESVSIINTILSFGKLLQQKDCNGTVSLL